MTVPRSRVQAARRLLRRGSLATLAVLAPCLVSAATALGAGTPTVTLVSPVCGSTAGGTSVTISGTNFTDAGTAVSFGSQAATAFTVDSPTSITATSPPGSGTVDATGSGTVDITVSTPSGTSATSSADQFTYAPNGQCAVDNVVPSCGAPSGGTQVIISGPGVASDDAVDFGTTPATSVHYVPPIPASPGGATGTPAYLRATAPPGIGTVPVTVHDATGTSVANDTDRFTYVADGDTFGVCAAGTSFADASGRDFTLAGGHPASVSADFSFATDTSADGLESPVQNVKDVTLTLPQGFIASPAAIAAECPQQDFDGQSGVACPYDSQVGWVTFVDSAGARTIAPIYDVAPPPGHLAEFAVEPLAAEFIPVGIEIYVDLNSNYQVTASIPNLTTVAPILGAAVTFFGTTPGATRPLLYFPPSCSQESSLTTTIAADSWNDPGALVDVYPTSPGPSTGCALDFSPTITVAPSTTQADSAAGYDLAVAFPAATSPLQAESPSQSITVALPPGTSVNPAAVDGATACTSAQFGLGTNAPATCPASSEVGVITAETPLLAGTFTGGVYLAQDGSPATTPALPLHVFAEAAALGFEVKLEGTLNVDAVTGQITATFSGLPPIPLAAIGLRFNTGPYAVIANPLACGPATTTATLVPWSSPATPSAVVTSTFTVDADGHGGACPSAWPSDPVFTAGSTNPVAGAFTGFTLNVTRADRQAPISSFTATTPPGFTGLLGSVPMCQEPAASSGACPSASAVGTVWVGAGVGDDSGPGSPSSAELYLSGTVYLTGPTDGDPFGLEIVVEPIVGPFNLSEPFGSPVIVRAGVTVNPLTAQLTIGTTLPTMLDGIALHARTVSVTIDRANFGLNPTDCSPLAVTGTIDGAPVSSPFQVGGCSRLAFAPQISATVSGVAGANGVSLQAALVLPSGNANLKSVALRLPSALGARLSTVQFACPVATFNADPAGCDAGAVVGTASARTPILPGNLVGTVYLVAHGGSALPTLNLVLTADGINVSVVGTVALAGGVTTASFASIPDVPISSLNLDLPKGPRSLLATSASSLCGLDLQIPTTLVAHNGATIVRNTPVAVSGCAHAASGVKAFAATVHGARIFVRVDLVKAGVVTVSGAYVKRYSHRLSAGVHRIAIALTRRGVTAQRRHPVTTVKLAFPGVTKTVKLRL